MTRAIPSREFFVRQAILNAALLEKDAASIKTLGMTRFLGLCTSGAYVRCSLCDNVRAEYQRLVSQYMPPRAAIASGYADALRAGQRRFR